VAAEHDDDVCAVFAPEKEALCNGNFALHNGPASGAKNAQNPKVNPQLELTND